MQHERSVSSRSVSTLSTTTTVPAQLAIAPHFRHQQQLLAAAHQQRPLQPQQRDEMRDPGHAHRCSSVGRELAQLCPTSPAVLARMHLCGPVVETEDALRGGRCRLAPAPTRRAAPAVVVVATVPSRRARAEAALATDAQWAPRVCDAPPVRCRSTAEGHLMTLLVRPEPARDAVVCFNCARRAKANRAAAHAGWLHCRPCDRSLCAVCVADIARDPRCYVSVEDWSAGVHRAPPAPAVE